MFLAHWCEAGAVLQFGWIVWGLLGEQDWLPSSGQKALASAAPATSAITCRVEGRDSEAILQTPVQEGLLLTKTYRKKNFREIFILSAMKTMGPRGRPHLETGRNV